MKCSNPNCGHGIGLVSYQRGWLDKRRFCSKKCRDAAGRPRPSQQERLVGSYFNWLLANVASQDASGGYSRKLARECAVQRNGGRPRSSVRIART